MFYSHASLLFATAFMIVFEVFEESTTNKIMTARKHQTRKEGLKKPNTRATNMFFSKVYFLHHHLRTDLLSVNFLSQLFI